RHVGAVRRGAARTACRALGVCFTVGLAAACGSPQDHDVPLGAAAVPSARPEAPLPAIRGPVKLVVTVVDGDRSIRVRRADVRLWGRSARTDLHGVAEIRVPWRRPLNVTVGAPGFGTRVVHEEFLESRKVTI